MTHAQNQVHRIELRLNELPQLFNSMDPTPFHHKDLDHDAEEFIESWALEIPKAEHFRITVHHAKMPQDDSTELVTQAIGNYYADKAGLVRRKVAVLLREGRISLMIGAAFLSTCLLAADLLTPLATGTLPKILRESLTIGGWVAMWRPMQIFLYEWWPLVRRGRIYRNLSRAEVVLVPAEPHFAAVKVESREISEPGQLRDGHEALRSGTRMRRALKMRRGIAAKIRRDE